MPVPPKLEQELDILRTEYDLEVIEDSDFINLIFRDFPLGALFSVPSSKLLLRVPKIYPEAGPDMFYTDPAVRLANGELPKNTESVETFVGTNWRRFSWHRQQPWHPIADNMHSCIEFIRRRLRKNE